MRGLYVETSVFLLAVGGDHPDREPSRRFLRAAAHGCVRLHASVEAVQEFVVHRMRRTSRQTALEQTRNMAASCVLLPFDDEVLTAALRLIEESPVRGRDAVHAATATLAGFGEIVSLDTDFDTLPGLRRIHPSHASDTLEA